MPRKVGSTGPAPQQVSTVREPHRETSNVREIPRVNREPRKYRAPTQEGQVEPTSLNDRMGHQLHGDLANIQLRRQQIISNVELLHELNEVYDTNLSPESLIKHSGSLILTLAARVQSGEVPIENGKQAADVIKAAVLVIEAMQGRKVDSTITLRAELSDPEARRERFDELRAQLAERAALPQSMPDQLLASSAGVLETVASEHPEAFDPESFEADD